MPLFRRATELLARRTTRRGLFGRGGDLAFGALIGAAAGTLARPDALVAQADTVCGFPGPPCPCDGCQTNGTCAKPCIIMTGFYAGGCWITFSSKLGHNVTCCDCDCNNFGQTELCGCGSDYHNDSRFCS